MPQACHPCRAHRLLRWNIHFGDVRLYSKGLRNSQTHSRLSFQDTSAKWGLEEWWRFESVFVDSDNINIIVLFGMVSLFCCPYIHSRQQYNRYPRGFVKNKPQLFPYHFQVVFFVTVYGKVTMVWVSFSIQPENTPVLLVTGLSSIILVFIWRT